MGASEFFTCSVGKTPAEAFKRAVDHAKYMYGHGGYTGTIAEKDDFVFVPIPEDTPNTDPREFADSIIEEFGDKYGPAGCVLLGPDKNNPDLNKYLFFGWASS